MLFFPKGQSRRITFGVAGRLVAALTHGMAPSELTAYKHYAVVLFSHLLHTLRSFSCSRVIGRYSSLLPRQVSCLRTTLLNVYSILELLDLF